MLGQSPSSQSFSRQPSLRSQLSASSPTPDRHLDGSSGIGACGGASGSSSAPVFSSSPLKLDTSPSKIHLPFSQMALGMDGGVEEGGKVTAGVKGSQGGQYGGSLSLAPQQEAILRDLCEKRLEVSQGLLQVNIALTNLQRQVEEVEGRVEGEVGELEGRYCHGVYVWRLREFPRIVDELRERPVRVLHSPPFYTSPFGYKFCLRLNLTRTGGGNGGFAGGVTRGVGRQEGANTGGSAEWLSLFIHGMRSENDAFLDWPFAGTIMFSILDCGNAQTKAHISEALQSSPDRQAFSRPQAHRNPKGFGYTEFASLKTLLNGSGKGGIYILDGTLHIKATVRLHQNQQQLNSEGSSNSACICQHQKKVGKV